MSFLNSTEINEPKTKQKRFLEKFKSKLFELFFTSTTTTTTPSTTTSPSPKISKTKSTSKQQQQQKHSTGAATLRRYSNGSLIENSISNYYYGYITNNFIYENDKKSIKNRKKSVDSVSRLSVDSTKTSCSSSTTSSSVFAEPIFNPVATNEPKINPFLNRNLTELLSFEQFAKFNSIKSHFESSLATIDDENNFFDVEFMTNYISYVLMDNLTQSSYLLENNLNLVPNEPINLLKQIAREIFLQSECEPCGLKGCTLSVHIQSDTDNESPQLLSQFKFGTNCYLTTFQLDLALYYESNNLKVEPVHKNKNFESNTKQNVVRSDTMSKSLKNMLNFRGPPLDVAKLDPKPISTVYLNSEFYVKKFKLY